MYQAKGQMTKSEYYRIYFLKYRLYFFIIPVITLFLTLKDVDFFYLQKLSFYFEYGKAILFNWAVYLFSTLFGASFGLFLIAFLKKESQLQQREYLFSEENLTIRTEIGETKIPWKKIDRLKEKKNYFILLLSTREKIYLMNHFFSDKHDQKQVLAFIRKKLGEKQ